VARSFTETPRGGIVASIQACLRQVQLRVGTQALNLSGTSVLAVVGVVLAACWITGLLVPSASITRGEHRTSGDMDPNVKKSATNLDAFDPMLKNERLQFSEGIRYEGTGRNIFKVEVPVSSRPHRPEPTHSSGVPPNESSLQTVRLRFFGFASAPGDFKRIFLSNDGDSVHWERRRNRQPSLQNPSNHTDICGCGRPYQRLPTETFAGPRVNRTRLTKSGQPDRDPVTTKHESRLEPGDNGQLLAGKPGTWQWCV